MRGPADLGPSGIVRVDSAAEQYAHLIASFGDQSRWEVIAQTWRTLDDGEAIVVATLKLSSGDSIDVQFGAIDADDDSFDGSPDDDGQAAIEWLDRVMQAAVEFSEANPPHHPGTIARFPVPAAGYANALSVPMGLIALDGSSPGLYAPPRIVALNRATLAAIGVGEFPGFDPELWPPERVSEWPLPSIRDVSPDQLRGIIQRFSACWLRVLNTWFGADVEPYRFLKDDIAAALHYRSILDSTTMDPYYDRMNPAFAKWLHRPLP